MKETAKVHIYRFSELDGLEIKEATFYNKSFPKHFHTEWSLCRINLGCENIFIENKEFCLFTNATILIPPFSVHANWGNENLSWKYQSIQINPQNKNYTSKIENILILLFDNKIRKEAKLEKTDIISYLNSNFADKITLSGLERKFKMNRYKILRNFKAEIGMTPQEYIMALRMENAKKSFFEGKKIIHIALDNGFYDQSHFVHTFKRYFGITPFSYKSNCNILQD